MTFSIRRLINILVIVSSLSLLTLGVSAIISNFMMNNNQNGLINAIMIESLSGNISNLIASDLARQEDIYSRERDGSVIDINIHDYLKGPFYAIYKQLVRLSSGYPELNTATLLLKKEYDSFMRAEKAIIYNMNDTTSVRKLLKRRMIVIDSNASMIRKKLNYILGKLMLRQARISRALRKSFLSPSITVDQIQEQIKSLYSSEGTKIQRLSNNAKAGFLKFLAVTNSLRNEENMDQLNDIRFNSIIQPMYKVNDNLKKMLNFLNESDPLRQEVIDMSEVFSTLTDHVLYNYDSIYEFRKALNENEYALIKTKASLFNNVKNINAQLFKLKGVVTKISDEIIPASKRLSSILLMSVSILALIFLTLFIFLGRNILTVITTSLNKLVDAMVDISSGNSTLDQRVDIPPHKELAKLSNSFNEMIAQLEQSQLNMQKLNKAYQKFVPEKGLELLGRSSITQIRLGDNSECLMSVLFSDIRDFTSITEQMTASESFDFINEYLKVMEPIIEKYNGFIDKYIGDAVMALFPDKLGADDAVKAAIEMLTALEGLNSDRKIRGLIPIDIGVGVNTGDLILGTIGGEIRMEETVIGDTVNVASRMESLNKQFGTHILISECTFKSLSSNLDIKVRGIGYTAIKGKVEKAAAYEVYSHYHPDLVQQKTQVSDQLLDACGYFELDKRKEAVATFTKCKALAPMDPVIDYYLNLLSNHSRREGDATF